jgi:hypothetical protein
MHPRHPNLISTQVDGRPADPEDFLMPTVTRWRAMPRVACFYAAGRLARGDAPALSEISAAPADATAELVRFLAAAGLPVETVCERLVSAAGSVDSTREAARVALVRAVGTQRAETHVAALAGLLRSLEAAFDRAFPTLGDELELRSRPLRELWEAHGPGLLAAVGRSTDKRLLVDEATVLIVQPFAAAGGGAAYPQTNSVAVEAVLANPHPRLPETVRLAWLVGRLQADLPDFVESLPAGAAETTMAWGMLPAVLEAAVDLEVVRPADDLVSAAAEAWRLPSPHGAPIATLAEATAGWWAAYRARPVPFTVALAALDRLLREPVPE